MVHTSTTIPCTTRTFTIVQYNYMVYHCGKCILHHHYTTAATLKHEAIETDNLYKHSIYLTFDWHLIFVFLPLCASSGESGSGKTVACKHIVRHLTARSSLKGFALEPRMKHVSLDLFVSLDRVSWRLIWLRNL